MKELKDLSPEERTLITIGCEPFYLHYTKSSSLRKVYNELYKLFSSKYEIELWTVITAMTAPIKNKSTGSMFTLDKNNFTKANKLNKDQKTINYTRCRHVLSVLEEQGYLELYKGFFDFFNNQSLKSCIVLTDKGKDLFIGVKFEKVNTDLPESVLIELRSNDGDPITDLSKLYGINERRSLVKDYNESLKHFDIRCKYYKVVAVYKRVFTENLELHGRWYAITAIQTSSSDLRKYLTINGYKTTEVDFRQMHPRILMELNGVYKPMSWEPYVEISDIVGSNDHKQCRSFSKIALMCLINASSLKSAKAALWKHYSDDKDKEKEKQHFPHVFIKKGDIDNIFNRLMEQNSEIAHEFSKPMLWAKLQHYDSEIAATVIEKFVSYGKCILPWHDSFVVSVEDQDLLIYEMRDAWKKVIGSNKNCFYDIEF